MAVYAVYDNSSKNIINVIVYNGIAEYDPTIFHGVKAEMVVLGKTDLHENVGIGDKYTNGKFEKKQISP